MVCVFFPSDMYERLFSAESENEIRQNFQRIHACLYKNRQDTGVMELLWIADYKNLLLQKQPGFLHLQTP